MNQERVFQSLLTGMAKPVFIKVNGIVPFPQFSLQSFPHPVEGILPNHQYLNRIQDA
jgi:hypothetical protein